MKYFVEITQVIKKMKFEYEDINRGYEDKAKKVKLHADDIDMVLEQHNVHKIDEVTRKILVSSKKLLLQQQQEIEVYRSNINEEYKQLFELERMFNKLKGYHKKDEGLKFLDIQQEERRRVARELHDSTVQNLTSLIYKTELCSRFLDNDITRVRLELQLMIVALRNIIEEMRQIIYDLRPDDAVNGSFHSYINKYIQECNMQHSNIEFSLFVKGKPRDIQNIYFEGLSRIIKEGCHNAVKYSKAKNIDVTLEYGSSGLKVKIADNGVGFNWEEYRKSEENKFGISIMQERAELMRAKFNLNSVLDKGTSIYVEVPKCLSGVN